MSNRDKRLDKAQMRVLFTVPFFAPGVARLPVTWDKSIPTACTDGKGIKWNPDWFDTLDDKVLPTVLCHEVCHCMLGHLWRAPEGTDWQLWNQATDHAVNLMLKEFGAQVTSQRLADPFPFPQPEEAYCADKRFSGMAEEAIYSALGASKPPQNGSGGNQTARGGQSPQQGGNPKQGKGPKSGSQPGNQPGPGSMPSFGDIEKPSGADPSSNKSLQSDWDGELINAVKIAQGRGEVPGSISRLVSELVSPQLPWWEILRSWLREQCSDDWNFLHPAMEYTDSGFIMPSLKSEKIGAVVFATDTSGSINNDLAAKFQVEKENCLNEMRPSKLVDIYCDSRIQEVREYTVGDTMSRDIPGGGGTDFRPVFEHVEKMDIPPKCIVYLTDLDGRFPDDPGVPCIWVAYGTDKDAPFGQTVHVRS